VRLLPGLMAIALICMLLAGALLFFAPQSSQPAAGSPAAAGRLAVLSQSLPLKAQAAVHGDSKAFDALSKGRNELDSTLKGIAAADPATANDTHWKQLLDAADKVLDGREPAEVVGKSATQVRDLMPKLLAEVGNLSGVVGGNKIEAIGRQL